MILESHNLATYQTVVLTESLHTNFIKCASYRTHVVGKLIHVPNRCPFVYILSKHIQNFYDQFLLSHILHCVCGYMQVHFSCIHFFTFMVVALNLLPTTTPHIPYFAASQIKRIPD